MPQYLIDDNSGSGNGLVPSGNKPLLEQYGPKYVMPYAITRGQWVDL